jgi:NAD(P)-dependent dehydrogenase (short-subunit alcohol dehydrogenase family)
VSVALVTGGSRGLGRAASRALTAAGWTVAVTGRDAATVDDVVSSGDAALGLPGDATDPVAVSGAVRRARDELGEVELLVANAGSFAAGGRLWETDPDLWWRDVEVNLRGPALALHAVLSAMVERRSGRVVVLGSGMGAVPTAGASAYSTSKAAVLRLVDTVAAELAGTGVVVIAVSPGMVPTDMTRAFPEGFLQLRPELRDPGADAWREAGAFTDLLLRIAAGELDRLHGRFVHVRDDVALLLAAAEQHPSAGTLRLTPWTT